MVFTLNNVKMNENAFCDHNLVISTDTHTYKFIHIIYTQSQSHTRCPHKIQGENMTKNKGASSIIMIFMHRIIQCMWYLSLWTMYVCTFNFPVPDACFYSRIHLNLFCLALFNQHTIAKIQYYSFLFLFSATIILYISKENSYLHSLIRFMLYEINTHFSSSKLHIFNLK